MLYSSLLYYGGRRYPQRRDNMPTGRSRVARGFHPKKDGTTRVRSRKR